MESNIEYRSFWSKNLKINKMETINKELAFDDMLKDTLVPNGIAARKAWNLQFLSEREGVVILNYIENSKLTSKPYVATEEDKAANDWVLGIDFVMPIMSEINKNIKGTSHIQDLDEENKAVLIENLFNSNVNFGIAIEAAKQGKRITREGWNGKGLFVFMQVPSVIGKEIVPKMQSLPQAVKDEFVRRFESKEEQIDSIYYDKQMCLVNPSNLITGWSPSTSDALSNDWIILD